MMIIPELSADVFTISNVLAGILASTLISLTLSWLHSPRYPKTISWVGKGKSFLSSFSNIRDWIQGGYDKYSKQGKAFGIPGGLGTYPEVVIPRSQMSWMLEQPDNVLSTNMAHYDILHGDYSFHNDKLLVDPYHEHVIHRSLARHLNSLIPELDEQVRTCVDEQFGLNSEDWKTVNLWDAFLKLIPRVTNILLVGKPLCDNKEYIDNMVGFTNDVTRNLVLFPFIPRFLKPLVGPLAAMPSHYHYRKTAKHSVPLARQRLADIDRKESGDPAYKDWKIPNDYVTWHITLARAEGRMDELTSARITERLLPLNFAAIHTTLMTAHNFLLDILAYDAEQNILAALRDEVKTVWAEQKGGEWDKAGLTKLHRLDSAIRESMRLSLFAQTLILRKVVAPDGVTNPETGEHFTYGSMLSCPLWGTHHDQELYGNDASRYDAFRFSRAREEYEARPDEQKNPKEGLKFAKMGMVTTSNEHFPFGHGRHACPGRFFVAHELKMLYAYLLVNYEFKPLQERPPYKWIGRTGIPPVGATIEVKRNSDPNFR